MWIYRKRKIPTTLVVYVLGERERKSRKCRQRETEKKVKLVAYLERHRQAKKEKLVVCGQKVWVCARQLST